MRNRNSVMDEIHKCSAKRTLALDQSEKSMDGTAFINIEKKLRPTTKAKCPVFFQLSTQTISFASPLHWIIYVVNNNLNLKMSCLLHLWKFILQI